MIFALIGILLFYLWSYLPEKSHWHKLPLILVAVVALGAVLVSIKTTIGAAPIGFAVSKAWLYLGIIGWLIFRSRDSRLQQALILSAAIFYGFQMLKKQPKPKASSLAPSATPELLIATSPSAVTALSQSYEVDLQLVVADSDKTDDIDLPTIYTVDVPNDRDDLAIAKRLSKDSRVAWLEYNDEEQLQWRRGGRVVDDPLVADQWAYDFLRMDAYHQALGQVDPKQVSKLFILDSGLEAKHEDLAANYSRIRGQSPRDPNGHGTHCSGIAAAVTNNGVGVASFSPGRDWVDLHSIAVINAFGVAPQSAVIRGIVDAADRGASVISMSLGGVSRDTIQKAYNAAIDYATAKGAIVVVAAGNSKMPASKFSPASCRNVITVAAVGQEGVMAPFTNTVADVQRGIAAPGVDILSTFRDGKYKTTSGTSMATPMVAGLATVCKAIEPTLTTDQFYELLVVTGQSSSSTTETGKIIDPLAVIEELLSSR